MNCQKCTQKMKTIHKTGVCVECRTQPCRRCGRVTRFTTMKFQCRICNMVLKKPDYQYSYANEVTT